jgi:hypothetical protein
MFKMALILTEWTFLHIHSYLTKKKCKNGIIRRFVTKLKWAPYVEFVYVRLSVTDPIIY